MTPKRVLIVGNGAAAWMTAAHLNAVLNRSGRTVADICVVETEDIPVTGVGAATLASINRFLAILGVDQADFMQRVDGTFKQASKFVNWLHASDHSLYHPFDMRRQGVVDRSAQQWLKSNRSIPFVETVSAQPALCEMNLAALMLGRWDFGTPISYAFHLDESKFARYLRELATARGVEHHVDGVAGVVLRENGDIAALRTSSGRSLEAELFIDCTGSAALLSAQQQSVRWVDCSQWSPCDRTLTVSVPYEQHYPGHVHPYTSATALSAGWVMDVPLLDRRSLSFVHSSDFLGDEQALQELLNFEGAHMDAGSCSVTHHRTGHQENAWVRNCISIGASSSSIESLESTSLYLIDFAAEMLVDHFPYGAEMEPLAYRYNRIMVNRFYEILDFVNLHYCLSRRTDSEFWREMGRPEKTTERLQAKLAFWRMKRPTPADFEDPFFPGQPEAALPASDQPGDYRSPVDTAGLWNHENYEAILYGMDFLHAECDDWYGTQRPLATVGPHIVERLKMAPRKLPTHAQWLQQVLGMPDYSAGGR